MIINSISNIYSLQKTLPTNLSNQPNASINVPPNSSSVSSNSTVASESIDFTNMSPREFNNLFKSGRVGNDLPPIALPKNGMVTHNLNPNEILDQKFDYIDNVSKIIAFNKSIGASTELYDRELKKMLALQGKPVQQSTINSYA